MMSHQRPGIRRQSVRRRHKSPNCFCHGSPPAWPATRRQRIPRWRQHFHMQWSGFREAMHFPAQTTDKNGVMVWNPALEWTGGGLISTSRDQAKWRAALLGGQGVSEETLNTILQPVPIGDDMPGTYYGLGVAISRSDPLSPVFGHGGWIPGYSSSLRHYAQSGITIAFHVNSERISHQSLSEIELCLARVVISSGEKTDCVP